jgi:hypothetical protein
MGDEVMEEVEQRTQATRGTGDLAPWVEKYRPTTIDDLQQQDQVRVSSQHELLRAHLRVACPPARVLLRRCTGSLLVHGPRSQY